MPNAANTKDISIAIFFHDCLQQQMKKNRVLTRLQLDKYYPTLRLNHPVHPVQGIAIKINHPNNAQTTPSQQKKRSISQDQGQSPALPLINMNRGQEYMRSQGKFCSLDILHKERRASLRPKEQYIIGEIQYIKNMLQSELGKSPLKTGVFILIQQNQLKKIVQLKRIGLLFEVPPKLNSKIRKSFLLQSNHPSRVRLKSCMHLSINKTVQFKVEAECKQTQILQNKQKKMEPILRKTKFRFAEKDSQSNNGLAANQQDLKILKDVKSFHNIPQKLINSSKSMKSIVSNSDKKKTITSIASSTKVKSHYNIKLKQLQIKQKQLKKKETQLLDRMNHLRILEDKYFLSSFPSHKQILSHIEVFKQYKKLQSQFIQPKSVYKTKLKSKIDVDLPTKFQIIKQDQLQQLKIASQQEQLINKPDLLIKHIIYIVGQAYYSYLDGLREMKESSFDIMEKVRRWAININQRRTILQENNKEFIIVFSQISILLQELLKNCENDVTETHSQNIKLGEEIMELQRRLQKNYKIYISFI